MGMHCLLLLNNQKVLDCSGRKENIPLDLINSWSWHEFTSADFLTECVLIVIQKKEMFLSGDMEFLGKDQT